MRLTAFAQQAYPTPEAATDALVDALGTTAGDQAKLSRCSVRDGRITSPSAASNARTWMCSS